MDYAPPADQLKVTDSARFDDEVEYRRKVLARREGPRFVTRSWVAFRAAFLLLNALNCGFMVGVEGLEPPDPRYFLTRNLTNGLNPAHSHASSESSFTTVASVVQSPPVC